MPDDQVALIEPQDRSLQPSGESPIKGKRAGIVARLLHGTGAGAVSYGLGIASNLLLLPLYLRFWSVSIYGEWMALYAVVSYFGNLDAGVTAAALNAATIAYAGDDWQAFKRIQGTAWAATLTIAGCGSLAVIALSSLSYFHLNRWLGLTVMSQHDSRIVFCGLAFSLLAGIPGNQLILIYTTTGEFVKYQWLYNAYSLLLCISTALALILGARPPVLAAVTMAMTLFNITTSMWLLRQQGARLFPRLRDADWLTARSLAAPTGQFGLSMFASVLTIQGPIVILSRALGGPAVALFTTTRTVANIVRGTLTLLRAPLRPEFGAAAAQPGRDALRRLFRIAVSLDATIAISLSAALWYGGVWLIRSWSHGRIQPDPALLHLLLISSVLEGFLQILAIAGWATNRIKAVSLGQLASAVISLTLAVSLIGRFGPSAVPLGAIIPLIVIMTPVALRNACSEADLPLRFVVGRLLLPFAAIAVFSAAFPAWIASWNLSPAWLSQVTSSLVVCVAAVVTSGLVFLTRSDRDALRARITLRLSKNRNDSSLLVTP